MASTSSAELALTIVEGCLRDGAWNQRALDELAGRALSGDRQASADLFRVVVERLGDLFEPRLCDVYASLFSHVIALARPDLDAEDLRARYERLRNARRCTLEPSVVYVLSRITLGADVAVTSVVLDAARRRFPNARVVFVGPRKNFALFEDSELAFLEFSYQRAGSLAERLRSVPVLDTSDAIVLDPDSRLTQLGLLPVCPDERYFFFESRARLSDTELPLPAITADWCREVLDVDAAPFIAPKRWDGDVDVAVSFGVGENPEKQMPPSFERGLLEGLIAQGRRVVVDRGAGADETARVDAACEGLPNVERYTGDYAPFAARIARARLYIGYDSAGQHVAAAAGTPLISVFRGFVSERMLQRWKPSGHGRIAVLPVRGEEDVLPRVLEIAGGWR